MEVPASCDRERSWLRYDLPGGSRLIHLRRTGPVDLAVVWPVGYRSENLHEYGFAHVVEHLQFFEQYFGRWEGLQVLYEAGYEAHAHTRPDYTAFWSSASPGHFPMMFELELRRLERCVEDDSWLRTQIDVVEAEIREKTRGRIADLLCWAEAPAQLWADDRFGHDGFVSVPTLSTQLLASVKAFVTREYDWSNAVVAVCSEDDPSAVRRVVSDGLARMIRKEARSEPVANTAAVRAATRSFGEFSDLRPGELVSALHFVLDGSWQEFVRMTIAVNAVAGFRRERSSMQVTLGAFDDSLGVAPPTYLSIRYPRPLPVASIRSDMTTFEAGLLRSDREYQEAFERSRVGWLIDLESRPSSALSAGLGELLWQEPNLVYEARNVAASFSADDVASSLRWLMGTSGAWVA